MGDNRNRTVALACLAGVAGMTALSFAAVPLYRLYCQVTGYAGTTQRAEKPSEVVVDRKITVRFDANVAPELPWDFKPVVRTMPVKIGENVLAFYRATNRSDRPVTGTAGFNVTPDTAGVHFNKIECFCFTEQVLGPGETVDMPVTFYVDPAFLKDPDTAHLTTITLSYKFYRQEQTTGEAVAATPPSAAAGEGG